MCDANPETDEMEYAGEFIYLMLLALLVMFWRAKAGRGLDQLIGDGEHEHHHVHRVIGKHPEGGSWRQHKAWMIEEEHTASPSH